MAETEQVRPALTPRQWEDPGRLYPLSAYVALDGNLYLYDSEDEQRPEERHTLAAIALYGQPFGFSHEDAESLREAASFLRRVGNSVGWANKLDSIADRIQALLPPEKL